MAEATGEAPRSSPGGYAAWALLIWLVFSLLPLSPWWSRVEFAPYDILNAIDPLDVDETPVVIVAIDEPSFADIAMSWPWPRALHARLIDQLSRAGARVVAFDVVFGEPGVPADDEALAEAIRATPRVVLAATHVVVRDPRATTRISIDPLPSLLAAGATAADVRLPFDPDGVLRRVPVAPESFWRVVAAKAGVPTWPEVAGRLIRFAGPSRTIPTVSYYQALDPDHLLPPGFFRDRVVLVGSSLAASPTPQEQQADMVTTPLLPWTGALLSGVEAHATIIEAARQGRLVADAPAWIPPLATAGCILSLLAGAWAAGPARSAALAALMTTGLAIGTIALFVFGDVYLPVVAPIAATWLAWGGNALMGFARERARRRFLRRAFGMYVSDEIIEHILADPGRLVLGGERREVTFVFTDVSGFTAMTERLDPAETVAVLRGYFEGMTETVFRHGGTLGQLLGDGMLLFFNAPVSQPDHARRAVACALDLARFARTYAREQQTEGIPIGDTRIGVNTGTVIVGNFGSSRRFLYTGVGDAINTAARLEGANKFFGTRICVSAATAAASDGIAFRPIGEVRLKGKEHHTLLLEPLMPGEGEDDAVAAYHRAYAMLERGETETAAVALSRLAADHPDDGLVAFHLRRLAVGAADARIVLTEK